MHDQLGTEAYRDDADYTSPEMQPGHGVDRLTHGDPADEVAGLAGMTIGIAGGALAGEVIRENMVDELVWSEPGTGAGRSA